ncbi:MBL fold metallo-hydrolase [Granulicoccus phenolivorans]|uniref:MBL fold metallo-hydrolase n=1 Tax=Granulicoccus phenolivorans TaxID=266854 RepID=UPI0003F8126F|nr:MBL fold metallo-hydrolase [Granulicoccus phenolivorans]
MSVRIDKIVTSGTFSLDGGTWEVDNNVYVIGDDRTCLIIDPAHDPQAVADLVGGREVSAIVLTHGHDDHIRESLATQRLVGGKTYLNPVDTMLWQAVHGDAKFDEDLHPGDKFTVGDVTLEAVSTPGHSPGSMCLIAPQLGEHGVVFSGDTLFSGGPGATGRSYSDFPTIIASIKEKLFPLPDETVVLTGHGDSTTIGAERPHLQEWIDRGH